MRILSLVVVLGVLGCSSVIPFEVQTESCYFEIIPTGITVAEFWAERGEEISQDLKGITLKELVFYFDITNQIGSDTTITIVWALSGTAKSGETKIYVGAPEVISSGREGVDYVYLAKDIVLTNNQFTSFSVNVSSQDFLKGLVEKKRYWVLVKNNVSSVGYTLSSKQRGSFRIVIKGEKSIF